MKFKQGNIYHLRFLDHSTGHHGKMYMELIGMLIGQDKDYLYLTPWWVDTTDIETFHRNMEKASVLKSAIVKRKVVKHFPKI